MIRKIILLGAVVLLLASCASVVKLNRVKNIRGEFAPVIQGEKVLFRLQLPEAGALRALALGMLFADYREVESAYARKTGIFPIMHVVGLRKPLADEHPWLAVNLFRAFNEAKAIAMKRMTNPRIVPLAWYRDAWEEQERVLGPDPWEYGLTEKNRKVLETLVGYSHEQGLIKKRPPLDQLFLSVDTGRKRGGEYRI